MATVTVEPASLSIFVAESQQLTATPRAAGGTAISGRTVAWRSENTSVAMVSGTGSVSGVSAGTARITATVDGTVGAAMVTVQSPPPGCATTVTVDVAVGRQVLYSNSTDFCLQFPASSTVSAYLIGVQSVTGTAASLTPVTVRGAVAAGTAGVGPLVASAAVRSPPGTVPIVTPRAARLLRHRAAELKQRVREQEFLRGRLPRARRTAQLARSVMAASVPATVNAGDTVDVKYPKQGNACSEFTPVRAVVRHKGSRAIWIEDVNNPTGGYTEADFASFGNMFDAQIWTADTNHFGTPTDYDGNSRIVVVITKELNHEGILGRVYGVDFFPDDCAASNGGEYFYGITPDATGSIGDTLSIDDARALAPIIIAHEFAHIIQFGRRLETPGATSFQTIWELEGQATLAEEITGHVFTGNQVGQNYTSTVAFNEPPTEHPQSWYVSPFIDLFRYYGFEARETRVPGAPEQCGWLDRAENGNLGPCLGERSVYGVSWSFLRWLSDQYGPAFPGGEPGLHRALVEHTAAGFATISGVIGQPIDALLARWAAALYVDDRVAQPDPLLTFRSWNLFEIENRLVETARLAPRERGFANFTDDVSVRAGSSAYFRVSGGARPATLISFRGPAEAVLPPHMRLWIVRLQ